MRIRQIQTTTLVTAKGDHDGEIGRKLSTSNRTNKI